LVGHFQLPFTFRAPSEFRSVFWLTCMSEVMGPRRWSGPFAV